MKKVKVNLLPLISNINLPTVIKTAIIPGDTEERLFIATQVGEIYYLGDGVIDMFLDIRSRVIKLGVSGGGYDERGLLGLAFHPNFYYNGLFYLHYSVAGTQGPGALSDFNPNPCDTSTLDLKWTDRENKYDHIDTLEEWVFQPSGKVEKRRTILNLRRPFFNHNGINSLNFSPETGKLVLITGDGGSGYDPFNLSQDDMEVAGKIIEIDININTLIQNPPNVSRFNELPLSIQNSLTLIAKGIRNSTGITYQKINDNYIKYVGNVGQDLVESIYSFVNYKPISISKLVYENINQIETNQEEIINFGWRGWEGAFPTAIRRECSSNTDLEEKVFSFYNETVKTSTLHKLPLISYFHIENRVGKFGGTALTGVQPYLGFEIPDLTGNVVFIDLAKKDVSESLSSGFLAYTNIRSNFQLNDFSIIDTVYDFQNEPSYYVSLGTNLSQSKLYLGVYGSMNVNDKNTGMIFEIVP